MPTTLEGALEYYKSQEPRGEYVLVIEGKSREEKRQEEILSWESLSIEEHMARYEGQGMDGKTAMKQVARDRGSPNGRSTRICTGKSVFDGTFVRKERRA